MKRACRRGSASAETRSLPNSPRKPRTMQAHQDLGVGVRAGRAPAAAGHAAWRGRFRVALALITLAGMAAGSTAHGGPRRPPNRPPVKRAAPAPKSKSLSKLTGKVGMPAPKSAPKPPTSPKQPPPTGSKGGAKPKTPPKPKAPPKSPSLSALRKSASVASSQGRSSPLWTATKNQSGPENALGHFKKHGSEFPEHPTASHYALGARRFVTNPPAGTLTKVRPNGDKLFYNPKSNTFAAQRADGALRTMFRPADGIKYWNKQ